MDVDLGEGAAARLRDPGHRPAARRARPDVPTIARVARPATTDAPAARAAASRQPLDELDEVYGALALGLRDYVDKNGFGARHPRASPAESTRRSSRPSRPTPSGPSA